MNEDVYTPSEDTFLLIKAVSERNGRIALEIGAGKGLVASELAKKHGWVVATDISFHAARTASASLKRRGEPQKIDFVCCDSASAFRSGIFDFVCFNPPYLPSEGKKDLAVDGGKDGVEVASRLFQEATRVLGQKGAVVFVVSSLSDYKALMDRVAAKGFTVRVLDRKKLFFEELLVLEAARS